MMRLILLPLLAPVFHVMSMIDQSLQGSGKKKTGKRAEKKDTTRAEKAEQPADEVVVEVQAAEKPAEAPKAKKKAEAAKAEEPKKNTRAKKADQPAEQPKEEVKAEAAKAEVLTEPIPAETADKPVEEIKADVQADAPKAEELTVAEEPEEKQPAGKAKVEEGEIFQKVENAVKEPGSRPEIYVQSPSGGNITLDEIARKLPEGTETVFVRPDQNTLWWSKGEENGSVEIWK